MTTGKTEVKPGQIWQDWDIRYRNNVSPRLITVERIENAHAICTTSRGRKVRILLWRFKPNATGYKLVIDAPAPKSFEAEQKKGQPNGS